ncbi:putative ATP-dependent helicase yoaA [Beauveria bassiana D1-5]|uniref:DNA 5'-3' helicase n=1 Tax=Beauveria bassiana D1-5 TaxID=1245745 RepID=A0A0A2VEM8_BEABA|nr:putative ATP-dependent helicase yoaA [Beauveria bassiana D1-5]
MISGLPALSHEQQQQAVERIHELMADGMSSGEAIALVASEIRASHTGAYRRFTRHDPLIPRFIHRRKIFAIGQENRCIKNAGLIAAELGQQGVDLLKGVCRLLISVGIQVFWHAGVVHGLVMDNRIRPAGFRFNTRNTHGNSLTTNDMCGTDCHNPQPGGNVTDDFAADGQLAKVIPGFKPREAQREMAEAVTRAIKAGGELVVEAGTGTGKTYAYLAPALRSGKKVIISTGSKALQDQLFSRDLPTISRALKFTGRVALLKGRSNYLCLERLEQQSLAGGDLPVQALSDVMHLRGWASETVDGDISTCGTVAEDSTVWPMVTSTNDNCLGQDCPQYKDCFVVKARKKAMDADVVVVNHHLYLADMVVKESGFAELIPEAEVTIFDEAHQIPDIASQYFGQSISSRQLLDLAKDISIAYRTEVRDAQQLQKSADSLAQRTQDFRLQIGDPGYRGNLRELLADANIQPFSGALSPAGCRF